MPPQAADNHPLWSNAARRGTRCTDEGHGWWPYLVPYASFLLMTEFGGRLPDGAAPYLLAIKPAIVLGMILWFRAQGAYPEWRGRGARIGFGGGLFHAVHGVVIGQREAAKAA